MGFIWFRSGCPETCTLETSVSGSFSLQPIHSQPIFRKGKTQVKPHKKNPYGNHHFPMGFHRFLPWTPSSIPIKSYEILHFPMIFQWFPHGFPPSGCRSKVSQDTPGIFFWARGDRAMGPQNLRGSRRFSPSKNPWNMEDLKQQLQVSWNGGTPSPHSFRMFHEINQRAWGSFILGNHQLRPEVLAIQKCGDWMLIPPVGLPARDGKVPQ